jgi:D-lactate dehydrogenase (cytochrome)
VQSASQFIQMGMPIARCELLDVNTVRWFNRQSRLGLHESPMLLIEFHGSEAGVHEQAETVQALASEMGGENFEWATTPEDRMRLRAARQKA